MARHIMAVCVVCLLCAHHLPCEEHLQAESISSSLAQLQDATQRLEVIEKAFTRTNDKHEPIERRSYNYNLIADGNNSDDVATVKRRQKRHGAHGSAAETHCQQPSITKHYLQRINDEYAKGNETLDKSAFQRLLKHLRLEQLLTQDPNSTCINAETLLELIRPHQHNHDHDHDDEHQVHHHHQSQHMTTNRNESTKEQNFSFNSDDVLNLCPVLLYQLAAAFDGQQMNGANCIDSSVLSAIDNYETQLYEVERANSVHVWIYAFISVFACSILGLVGVAIIPFMDSRYYKHIIQFLVSLAVGTMTGDAVLHLLPHSLAGQTERNMIFKGLTCLGGIIFFYITEHGLTMISEWRKRIAKKEKNKPSRVKVMREPDAPVNNSVAGDKLCKSKYSSYPYCYDEIAMDTKHEVWTHMPSNNVSSETGSNENNSDRKRNGKIEAEAGEMAAQSLLSTSQNNYAPMTAMHFHCHPPQEHHQLANSNAIATELDVNAMGDSNVLDTTASNGNSSGAGTKDKPLVNDNTVTVILREHESSHHGHSHKHGHVHSPPESLSAVAWMIIMGDGLHNFTDGMAIGAAFADNIAGGFSTSLAVFCHELPHELGDFAILMKAGMSVKSAVFYNLLTGVLSFIGMIFGIVFGQTQESAQWMFAAAAGLFIYIALVDMMPELSAAHKSLDQFVLQVLGMLSGVFLMLLIAIYEDDLLNVFSSPAVH